MFGISNLTDAQIESIFVLARKFSHPAPVFSKNRTVFNVFDQPSTRTLTSFQIAEERLGLRHINAMTEFSSMQKGESLSETLRVLAEYDPYAIVVRSAAHADWKPNNQVRVINAGSAIDHPTQALIDVFTIGDPSGKTLGFWGDTTQSRVAKSLTELWERMGGHIRDPLNEDCEYVYVLRHMHERYGRLQYLDADQYLMHAGPVTYDEVSFGLVSYHKKSLVYDQVRNGVAVRMAVLSY